jgi:hypothetical protein
MQVIPLSANPSQTLQVGLNGQQVFLSLYQKTPIVDEYGVAAGLFLDMTLNGTPVLTGVRCLDRTRLLLDRKYLGFVGDLIFIDVTGTGAPTFTGAPPYYKGLGTQFVLVYLEASDLASL